MKRVNQHRRLAGLAVLQNRQREAEGAAGPGRSGSETASKRAPFSIAVSLSLWAMTILGSLLSPAAARGDESPKPDEWLARLERPNSADPVVFELSERSPASQNGIEAVLECGDLSPLSPFVSRALEPPHDAERAEVFRTSAKRRPVAALQRTDRAVHMPSWLERTRPLWTVWSRPQPPTGAGTDELCSLVLHDDDSEITLVRTLSVPNPLALLGNPLRWHGRFRADYQDDFDDLTRLGGNLIVSHGLPIGFDAEWNYWQHEDRRRRSDHFWSGDFNLVIRFGRFRSHEFRTGAGLNWIDDDEGTRLGWNTTYAFDYNFYGPWIMSALLDVGRLGSGGLLHGRITGGLELGRLELFAGYDFYEVGNRERKGPVAGVGLWF